MEVKFICANFVFMDLINPFGASGDVTWYMNMHNLRLFNFLNFHPFLLLYNSLKLALSYQTLSFLIFQENFREEPPCLLLHYSDYNHIFKWWLNLQCSLLPPKLKPMRPKMLWGSHMILIHGWCEMTMMRCCWRRKLVSRIER